MGLTISQPRGIIPMAKETIMRLRKGAIYVRAYMRFRLGRWERVRDHWRGFHRL